MSECCDISSLQNLSRLIELNLESNLINDISPLQNLTQLTKLNLATNQIRDIGPLQNLTQLNEVFLAGNCITDFSLVDNIASLFGSNEQGPCANFEEIRFHHCVVYYDGFDV